MTSLRLIPKSGGRDPATRLWLLFYRHWSNCCSKTLFHRSL